MYLLSINYYGFYCLVDLIGLIKLMVFESNKYD